MALRIETFSNLKGGNALFKALTHPEVARSADSLLRRLATARAVAIVDPLGFAESFNALYPLDKVRLAGSYVQAVAEIGKPLLGRAAQPLSEIGESGADLIFIAAFDSDRLEHQIAPLVPAGAAVLSLDQMRLDEGLLSKPDTYLDPLNFATNWALFRDSQGHHTRLVTANYWSGYESTAPRLAAWLYDTAGKLLVHWQAPLAGEGGQIVLDSREIRQRFGLGEFEGQLFIHIAGAAGHDVVKYALDTWEDDGPSLSCTHDANAWPADFYAGLPAPGSDERIRLWIANSLPVEIPAGAISLNLMGSPHSVAIDQPIAPFASTALDIGTLLPGTRWPEQIELNAGRYMVRPRYEIEGKGRRRIAHMNVERTDLRPDPALAGLHEHVGKGFLLPAPLLPPRFWRSLVLPTPMARSQEVLPIRAIVYDAQGREVAQKSFGRLLRQDSVALDLDEILLASKDISFAQGGHVELSYDFTHGSETDGWLHALFRYQHRDSGHVAETSFGAHIFNTIMTWRDEPQSYAGRAPGLSTRLFLRLGHHPFDSFCHLIYPASKFWRALSETDLILKDAEGGEIARRRLQIPCGGSLFWRYSEMFESQDRMKAGPGASVIIRDRSCRLFGYHGLLGENGRFSLDHMFGF